MSEGSELAGAFDAAIEQTRKCLKAEMTTASGESARPQLEALEKELRREREIAIKKKDLDREWFQKTLRSLVEWLPETEPTLIAALGRIARVKRTSMS